MPAQAAADTIAEVSRRRTRLRWILGAMLLIELALVVLWMVTFKGGPLRSDPWAVGWVAVMAAVAIPAIVAAWITWRCPACGKSPGQQGSQLNYCRACAIPLAEGASRRVEQTPERAEWVVATLRHRAWWVRGALVLALGVGGLLGWLLIRADMRSVGRWMVPLGALGWVILVARIWRCPECMAGLGGFDLHHFCTRCGVPHDRKGLERARARA